MSTHREKLDRLSSIIGDLHDLVEEFELDGAPNEEIEEPREQIELRQALSDLSLLQAQIALYREANAKQAREIDDLQAEINLLKSTAKEV